MSEIAAAHPGTTPTVVHLVGDVDLPTYSTVRERVDAALEDGRPILVDLGDCTFLDGTIVELLVDAGRRAREDALGFVVVLPYSASTLVRRVLLEVLPEEADFRIAPSVTAARALVARPADGGDRTAEHSRIRALRASLWENAARLHELQTQRDALLLELRRVRELARKRRMP